MTAPAEARASAPAPGDGGTAWRTLRASQVLQAEHVDEQHGLSSAGAASRAERWRYPIVGVTEVRKAVRRHTVPSHPITR